MTTMASDTEYSAEFDHEESHSHAHDELHSHAHTHTRAHTRADASTDVGRAADQSWEREQHHNDSSGSVDGTRAGIASLRHDGGASYSLSAHTPTCACEQCEWERGRAHASPTSRADTLWYREGGADAASAAREQETGANDETGSSREPSGAVGSISRSGGEGSSRDFTESIQEASFIAADVAMPASNDTGPREQPRRGSATMQAPQGVAELEHLAVTASLGLLRPRRVSAPHRDLPKPPAQAFSPEIEHRRHTRAGDSAARTTSAHRRLPDVPQADAVAGAVSDDVLLTLLLTSSAGEHARAHPRLDAGTDGGSLLVQARARLIESPMRTLAAPPVPTAAGISKTWGTEFDDIYAALVSALPRAAAEIALPQNDDHDDNNDPLQQPETTRKAIARMQRDLLARSSTRRCVAKALVGAIRDMLSDVHVVTLLREAVAQAVQPEQGV